jgi:hypothetical protein
MRASCRWRWMRSPADRGAERADDRMIARVTLTTLVAGGPEPGPAASAAPAARRSLGGYQPDDDAGLEDAVLGAALDFSLAPVGVTAHHLPPEALMSLPLSWPVAVSPA